jgi:hypothetical protein
MNDYYWSIPLLRGKKEGDLFKGPPVAHSTYSLRCKPLSRLTAGQPAAMCTNVLAPPEPIAYVRMYRDRPALSGKCPHSGPPFRYQTGMVPAALERLMRSRGPLQGA